MAPSSKQAKAEELEELVPSANLQTDNLAKTFTEAADDDRVSQRKREASMLFSVAESSLRDNDDPDVVLKAIDQAIKIFRELGNSHDLADSLRLWMHAMRMKAAKKHEEGRGDQEEEVLKGAEASLRREMAIFRACGHTRGEAAMLLSIGEALRCLGGSDRLEEALDSLLDAQDIACELADEKLEALIASERSTLLHKRHRFKQAIHAATEAQKLFKKIGDRQNEAFSWQAKGSAQINNGRMEEGIVSLRRALELYRQLGLRRELGIGLCTFSEWHLMEKDDFSLGIQTAEEAKAVFTDLEDVHWQLQAQRLIVEGHCKKWDHKKAMDLAHEGLQLAKQTGIQKEIFKALQSMAHVYKEWGRFDEAKETAAEVMALAKEMDDPRDTAQAWHLEAVIYDDLEQYDLAEERALEAVNILEPLRRYEEEAFQEVYFLGRARVKKKESDYEGALQAMKLALRLAERAGDVYLQATAHLGISAQHLGLDDRKTARIAAERSRDLFKEEGYQRGEAKVLRLALSEYDLDDRNFSAALSCAREAARLMEDVGDNRGASLARVRVASICLQDPREGMMKKAQEEAMEAYKLALAEADNRATVVALLTLLDACHLVLAEETQTSAYNRQLDKMHSYATRAVGRAVKIRSTELEAWSTYWVAVVYWMQGSFKEALQTAEKTIRLARGLKEVDAACLDLELNATVCKIRALNALHRTQDAADVLVTAIAKAETHSEVAPNTLQALGELLAEFEESQRPPGAFGPVLQSRPRNSHLPKVADVRSFIQKCISTMRGEAVADEDDLAEMGVDSLDIVELKYQLQQHFSVNLPVQVLYGAPTVSALAWIVVDHCADLPREVREVVA